MKTISTIIPIYNSAEYIDNLLQKIISIIPDNFEIVLVDDNSEDGSRQILEKYKKYDFIKIIFNKINMGVSYSRNIGLKNSNAKYVTFIDSDDFISDLYFKEIVKKINDKCDLIIFGTTLVYQNKKNMIPFKYSEHMTKQDLFNENVLLDIPIANWVTNKVFKYEIIERNNLQFDEKYKTGEDLNFMLEYLPKANNILFINKYLYYYNRTNEHSLTKNNIKNLAKNTYRNNKNIENFFCKHQLSMDYFYQYKKDIFIYVFESVYKRNITKTEKMKIFSENIKLNCDKNILKYFDENFKLYILNNNVKNIYLLMEEQWKRLNSQ